MAEVTVTLSANAGVAICVGGIKIWVDALYADKGSTFSPLTPQLRQQVLESDAFADPDYIFYTHCHGDHYSRELTALAMEKWPKAKVFLPRQELEGQILLTDREAVVRNGDVSLRFIKLPHEGAQYADVALYGLLISAPGCSVLLPGDCQVASPVLAQAVGDAPVDLLIADFPWITLARGRAFLEEHIRPSHILAYHLPFAGDDVNGYLGSARRAAERMENVQLLSKPLQTETIII